MARRSITTIIASIFLASSIQMTFSEENPNAATVRDFAYRYMKNLTDLKMSDREIAKQLASTIFYLEKMQIVCSKYYYIDQDSARFRYQLYQGTWELMFGPGKTSTAIMNEASMARNREFNNATNKQKWCNDVKQLGKKTFAWEELFESNIKSLKDPTAARQNWQWGTVEGEGNEKAKRAWVEEKDLGEKTLSILACYNSTEGKAKYIVFSIDANANFWGSRYIRIPVDKKIIWFSAGEKDNELSPYITDDGLELTFGVDIYDNKINHGLISVCPTQDTKLSECYRYKTSRFEAALDYMCSK